jgi:hypothetical protein
MSGGSDAGPDALLKSGGSGACLFLYERLQPADGAVPLL